MDYPYDKFGDCTFSHFGSVLHTDRQTHRCFTPTSAWVIKVTQHELEIKRQLTRQYTYTQLQVQISVELTHDTTSMQITDNSIS